MQESEILLNLDNCHNSPYCFFASLGDPYAYLIDSRINVFRNDNGKWAIAIEHLGDNPRAGGIILKIYFFGNCLINLDQYNNHIVNTTHRLIQVTEGPDQARIMVEKERDKFRATDDELYRSIPRELTKMLVIDEWYHRDFILLYNPGMSDEHIRYTYEFNKKLTGISLSYEQFAEQLRHQTMMNDEHNRKQWENNRPSNYETWQMIAKSIVSGNAIDYAPTMQSNSHWSNWPESGRL